MIKNLLSIATGLGFTYAEQLAANAVAEYNSRFGLECHSLDWDPCSCYTAGTAVDRASLDSGVLVGKRDEAVAHVGDLQLRKVYLLLVF